MTVSDENLQKREKRATPLFFVRKLSHPRSASQSRAEGVMLLMSMLEWDFVTPEWQAWAVGKTSISIQCRLHEEEALYAGADADDNHKSQVGRAHNIISISRKQIVKISENCLNNVDLSIEPALLHWKSPFFLSTDPTCCFESRFVRLKLSVGQYSQLPDVNAFLSRAKFHRARLGRSRVDEKSYLDELAAWAEQMAITPGRYLPGYVESDQRQIPCVIHLQRYAIRWFSHNPSLFVGQLFLSKPVTGLAPGTTIRRKVEWWEDDTLKCQDVEIAQILNVYQ